MEIIKEQQTDKIFQSTRPSETILDFLQKNDIQTIGIGKINELFNYRGIDVQAKTKSNEQGMEKILEYVKREKNSFIFVNLVDFDVYFGHRNDPEGFYKALQNFDQWLPTLLNELDDSDALIITADHGNDPTTPSTDHSREHVPLLFYRKNIPSKNLGTRETYSDVAQTIAHFFKVNNNLKGKSFLND
ncbi:MAG: alkaline phosphatase family protein [Melioribacteraceae bacterium]|nr:alkaline phosphatase family protein [Melioribacteraceae bacterium]